MTELRKKIILVSSFRPRECGIATFGKDLSDSLKKYNKNIDVEVIAVDEPGGETRKYDKSIKYRIFQNDKKSYLKAADYINKSSAIAVSIQHEYGLYGGKSGNYILTLLKNLKKPVLTTLHTISKKPLESEKKVLFSISELSDLLIVMANSAPETLEKVYDIPKNKVLMIPHGVPDIDFQNQDKAKKLFKFSSRLIISTFGLISRGKGIEYAIEALLKVREKFPNILYLIIGKTHPTILSNEGEEYRDSLIKRIDKLGLSDNVVFVNRFINIKEYINYLLATDIYLTPYVNPEQVTSGTLAYAMSAGRVCVSTPYIYAKELLKDGHGVLTPFNDSEVLAKTILDLFSSNGDKKKMELKNHLFTRDMTWENVSKKYADTFLSIINNSNKYATKL